MAEEESYTKYERARMLGSRALQLAMGAPFLIKISDEDLERVKFNPVEIAKMEFNEGVLPITVRRPLPGEKDLEKPEEAADEKKAA